MAAVSVLFYLSEFEFNSLIEKFENKSLPKERWTHHAHLSVGLHYSFHFSGDESLTKMRTGIIGFNETTGTINSESSGYHETITVFWMWSIREFLTKIHNQRIHTLANMLLNDPCSDKNNLLRFYSNEHLFSKEARARFVRPDLKEFHYDQKT